jgi:hypothetical protein
VGGYINKGFAQKGNLALASKRALPLLDKVSLPLLVLVLAVFVYGMYGFDGALPLDYSIYLYSGQRMAEGVPPYVSIFDHKGPLSPMIAGLGVMLSKLLDGDDIYTVRAVFFATGCLTVVAVYLLGKSVFRSQVAGFFAALTFLGFYAYGYPAASGPEPKTPMVLFQTLSLLLASQKRWFWAGCFGSLAFLVWQPMGVFSMMVFVLAVTRPKGERRNAALRALGGIATPLLVIVGYFYYYGALGELLDGVVLFNALYLTRGDYTTAPLANRVLWDPTLSQTLLNPSLLWESVNDIVLPYITMLGPIVIGLAMIIRLYFLKPYQYRFAPILLSFLAPPLWALVDFQLSDDFFVYLPYVAIGFGAFAASMTQRTKTPWLVGILLGMLLLGIAIANTFEEVNAPAAKKLLATNISLSEQREGASQIEERFGKDIRIASVNSPQVLALLHRENPNPYLFITAGIDRYIDAKEPGGFKSWLEGLETSDVISFFGEGQALLPGDEASIEHREELLGWLGSHYHIEKIGPWYVFVKDSLDNPDPSQKVTLREVRQ